MEILQCIFIMNTSLTISFTSIFSLSFAILFINFFTTLPFPFININFWEILHQYVNELYGILHIIFEKREYYTSSIS